MRMILRKVSWEWRGRCREVGRSSRRLRYTGLEIVTFEQESMPVIFRPDVHGDLLVPVARLMAVA